MAKARFSLSQKLTRGLGFVAGYFSGALIAQITAKVFGLSMMFARPETTLLLYLKIVYCLLSIILLNNTIRNEKIAKQKNDAELLSPKFSFLTNFWGGVVSIAFVFLIIPLIG